MSTVEPIRVAGRNVDFSGRVAFTNTVIASPSAASETVVATTPALDSSIPIVSGVLIICEMAYTIGTSGASCQVRVRRGTTTSGTLLYDSGAQTGGHNTAGQLVADSAGWFDTAATAGAQYSVTLTVASGAASSTVSKVTLTAIAF